MHFDTFQLAIRNEYPAISEMAINVYVIDIFNYIFEWSSGHELKLKQKG